MYTTTATTNNTSYTTTSTSDLQFKTASSTERQMMINFLNPNKITNLYFTAEDGYARFDGLLTIKKTNKEVIFEIKNRDLLSSTYTTSFIEKSKFDFLISSNIEAYVFIFFTDNKVLVHKLDKTFKYATQIVNAPSTTMGDNTIVEKTMVLIPISQKNLHNTRTVNQLG